MHSYFSLYTDRAVNVRYPFAFAMFERIYGVMYAYMYGQTYSIRLPILHVVSSTGKMNISLSTFAPENLVSRDGFGSPVPRQPAHLHTQAESGAYLWDFSRVPRRRPFIYLKPPYAIGSVPS